MAQYFASYNSPRALWWANNGDTVFALGLFGLAMYGWSRNAFKIVDLDFHTHTEHGAKPVNSDGEFLYLNGAWF